MDQNVDRYSLRGVSTSKAGVHEAIAEDDKGLFPGAFCRLLQDPFNPDRCMVPHGDGVGTKLVLPYLAEKEGSSSVEIWEHISQNSIVMNLDDVACVGATEGPYILVSLINRNPFRISDEVIAAIIRGDRAFRREMADLGIRLISGGGETADVADPVRLITIDHALFTSMPKADVIDASRIAPGDVIIGFSSTGQAAWEEEPNSGVGSNGLTNARHDVLSSIYREGYPEACAPEMPQSEAYSGSFRLTDPLPGDDRFTVGSALMSKTRTYMPLVQKLLHDIPREHVHGIIHCSGGGQTKIGKFGQPGNIYVKDDPFPLPPLFAFLQETRNLTWRETYKAYNCGWRLEVCVPPAYEPACLAVARDCNLDAKPIGLVEKGSGRKTVHIRTPMGFEEYNEGTDF